MFYAVYNDIYNDDTFDEFIGTFEKVSEAIATAQKIEKPKIYIINE